MTETIIPVKVYVQDHERALLVCPACGLTHELDAAKYRNQSHALTARCRCRNTLRISLEFRSQARKQVRLEGSFRSLNQASSASGSMAICNLSRAGIGFSVLSGIEPQVGEKLHLEFQLDDRKASKIIKKGVVKSVNSHIIGCAFDDHGELAGALGFYLQD